LDTHSFSDKQFIADNNLAYVKHAVLQDNIMYATMHAVTMLLI